MNCEQWQHQLLLAESGELADGDRKALDAHVATCHACMDFRNSTRVLSEAVRPVLRRGTPSPSTLAAIREEAAARVGGTRMLVLRPFVLQIAACAAAFALVVGGWFFLRSGESLAPDAIHQVGSLLTMVSEQHADGTGVPAVSASDEDARIRALARELLRMEGLGFDEVL